MQNHCARKPTHRKEKRETEGDAAPIAIGVDVDVDFDPIAVGVDVGY